MRSISASAKVASYCCAASAGRVLFFQVAEHDVLVVEASWLARSN
jgi:hypothetical protein